MQKAHSHPSLSIATEIGLLSLVSVSFQVYFTPLFAVLFTFPSRYWFTIGLLKYLALPDGPGRFRQNFTCSALLRILLGSRLDLCTGLSPSIALSFQINSTSYLHSTMQSYNPLPALTDRVWAVPRSLATTEGISDLIYIPPGT